MNLDSISRKEVGNILKTTAQITNITQTKGPTIFTVSDGHGNLAIKSFKKPGERAQTHIDIGDVVDITFKVTEFNKTIEGEGQQFNKVADQQAGLEVIEKARKSAREVGDFEFLVHSETTNKLRTQFTTAANLIKQAIIEGRPIVVRHHNDTDGYSAGVSLQRAIMPLIAKRQGESDVHKYFVRSACRAPFYEYEDSLRDTVMALGNVKRFGQKMPLVIIVDNGSGHEDLLSIQQGKIFGAEFIVIDHHTTGPEDVISPEVLAHINPHLVGEGYEFTAGMLCVEMAHILYPQLENYIFIAGMAGIADHTESSELEQFITLAEKDGYTRQMLEETGTVIEYIGRMLRNMEARDFLDILFGSDKDKQQAVVQLLLPKIRDGFARNLTIAQEHGKVEQVGNVQVQWLDVQNIFSRDSYPPPGRTTGIYHDKALESNPKTITFGTFGDGVIIRAIDGIGFSVHGLIAYINEKVPSAFADGGGHTIVGSIKFVPIVADQVFEAIRDYIRQL